MSEQQVLWMIIIVHFVGLFITLLRDPSHLLDAYRKQQQRERAAR